MSNSPFSALSTEGGAGKAAADAWLASLSPEDRAIVLAASRSVGAQSNYKSASNSGGRATMRGAQMNLDSSGGQSGYDSAMAALDARPDLKQAWEAHAYKTGGLGQGGDILGLLAAVAAAGSAFGGNAAGGASSSVAPGSTINPALAGNVGNVTTTTGLTGSAGAAGLGGAGGGGLGAGATVGGLTQGGAGLSSGGLLGGVGALAPVAGGLLGAVNPGAKPATTSQTNAPWEPAQPFIQQHMQNAQDYYNAHKNDGINAFQAYLGTPEQQAANAARLTGLLDYSSNYAKQHFPGRGY